MTQFLDKLNLTPLERRVVIFAALAVFTVLNVWLVIPHFKDWNQLQNQLEASRIQLANYKTEAAKLPTLQEKLKKIAPEGGAVPVSDSINDVKFQFLGTVQSLAQSSRIFANSWGTANPTSNSNSKTNANYFTEFSLTMQMTTGEDELIDFLYKLGASTNGIRVRDITLKPDPTQMKLSVGLTLVASYQVNNDAKPRAPLVPKTSNPNKK